MTGIRFPAGAMNGFFSLRHPIQTGAGAYPASHSMGTGGFFTEVKLSVEVKNVWTYTFTAPYIFTD
jgi:hypothetical protein